MANKSVLRGRRKDYSSTDFPDVPRGAFKVPTYEYIHCQKVEHSKIMRMDLSTGLNCSVKAVGKGVTCTGYDGEPALCFESVHLYETGKSPKYRGKR